jgi:hypothetical protein
MVHNIVTAHWRDIYSVPVASLSQALSLELPNLGSIDEWEQMLANPDCFVQMFKSALPSSVTNYQGLMDLQQRFSIEFRLSLDPRALTELSESLAEDPKSFNQAPPTRDLDLLVSLMGSLSYTQNQYFVIYIASNFYFGKINIFQPFGKSSLFSFYKKWWAPHL